MPCIENSKRLQSCATEKLQVLARYIPDQQRNDLFHPAQRKVIFGLFLSTSLYRLVHNFFGHKEHGEPQRTRRIFLERYISRCGPDSNRDGSPWLPVTS